VDADLAPQPHQHRANHVVVDVPGFRKLGAGMIAVAFAVPHLPSPGTVCPLRRFTGVPCPMCGMTTGVVATVYGHFGAAVSANPAAPLLVAFVLFAWGARAIKAERTTFVVPLGLVIAVGALMWSFELHRFGFL
jgi:hypothetical protein